MRIGYEPRSGLYYEVLGEPGDRPPVLFIHGGGATGACWRADLDGNPGWADKLADLGHEVWVTDWPGTGRSGNRNLVDIDYADVVAGYRALLRDVISRPVVVVPHSMGGATTWQLIEHEPDLVAGVVSLASSFPGNLSSGGEVLSDDGDIVRVHLPSSGADFVVDRTRGYLYEDDYIYKQGIGGSTRFPLDKVEQFRTGLSAIPPRMLLQRMGVLAGLPPVSDTTGFVGKRIRLVAGGEDPMHSHAIETATAELLRGWGAEVELCWLPDLGIEGNGHFLYVEDNRDLLVDVLDAQINDVAS